MIKGLTDNVIPRFPRLGKLRKGGEKNAKGGYGPDLDHFRFTSDNPQIVAAFHEAYGNAPAALNVYLPYPTVDENFATWKELWSAGGLVHRCDGETMQVWRTPQGTFSQEPKPCPGGCDEVGRLTVIVPELWKAGYIGYVTVETHSLHDMMNITAILLAVKKDRDFQGNPRGLEGIEFVLRRRKEKISTPGKEGQRVSRDKWLVSLEPVASWGQMYLAAAGGSTLEIAAPVNVDPETGEVLDDGDNVIDATAIVTTAQQAQETYGNARPWLDLPRPWSMDNVIGALRYAAEHTNNEAPADGTWGALIGLLDSKPFDTASRHTLLRAAFGVESSKELSGKQRYALLRWANPAKSGPEKSDSWTMSGEAIEEYRHIVGLDIETTDEDAEWAAIDAAGVPAGEAAPF